jgi:hypothetical protein
MVTATVLLAAGALLGSLTIPAVSQEKKAGSSEKTRPYVYVPDTVSPEFQELLKSLPDPALRPGFPAPDDRDGWKRFHQTREKDLEPRVERALKAYEPTLAERKLGGVPSSRRAGRIPERSWFICTAAPTRWAAPDRAW